MRIGTYMSEALIWSFQDFYRVEWIVDGETSGELLGVNSFDLMESLAVCLSSTFIEEGRSFFSLGIAFKADEIPSN